MRVGVNGREMADENIPLVLDVLQRMVRQGMEPQLTSGLAEWLIRKGVAMKFPILATELLSSQDLDLFIGLGGDGTLLDTVALSVVVSVGPGPSEGVACTVPHVGDWFAE